MNHLCCFVVFFRLSHNGNWYTIEKTQCEAPLLSTTVGHTYARKNQFFFISKRLLPFTVVPRKFSEVLNEKEPEVHELERELLLRLRAYRMKLRAYPEELLVVLGISQDWVDSSFEPVFFVDQMGMYFCVHPIFMYVSNTHVVPICFVEISALDYILLNDPFGVEIEQKEIPEGGPSIFCRTENVIVRFGSQYALSAYPSWFKTRPDGEGIHPLIRKLLFPFTTDVGYHRTARDLESVPIQPIVDSSSAKKQPAPTRRSTKATSSPNPISVDSGDENDANVIAFVTSVKLVKKEVPETSGRAGDAPGQKISAKKKKMEKVGEKVEMVLKEKVECDKGNGHVKTNLPIFVPQCNIRASDTTKSSDVCHDMLKNMDTPAEKEGLSKLSDEDSAYRGRVADEAVTEELRQQVKQLKEDKKWLIGSGIHGFVTYIRHIHEFNLHHAGIYSKAMAHGRHTRLIVGIDAASRGKAIEKLPAFKPDSLPDFVDVVKKMEALSYPYVEALSRMVGCPIAKLEALEQVGLNKELCEHLLSVASVKRALFGASDEEGDDVGPSSKRLKNPLFGGVGGSGSA
ncbi:hypothetical protein Hanom_Chr12g01092651 [Helianthus anomalus]